LHPYAIGSLADLIRAASRKCQIVIATQSVTLLNQFEPDEVVVCNLEGRSSVFRRLDEDQLQDWLPEYTLGDRQENVIGRRPSR
jgi:predicted ATPase